jgi:hypothetical protein
MKEEIVVQIASMDHEKYVPEILKSIEEAAKIRGTGIAKRSPDYVRSKIREGKAVIAIHNDKFVGFCYVESWGHQKFVANSGLIVVPEYRGYGVAKEIKKKAFDLSRQKFPYAKIFGLTTGLAVMKINSELGYKPVTFTELTKDDEFWKGCESCVNHDILMRTRRLHCLCTAMIFDPTWGNEKVAAPEQKNTVFQNIMEWFKKPTTLFNGKKKEDNTITIKMDQQ